MGKANDIDKSAANVSNVSAPLNAEDALVRAVFYGRVEISDLQIALADEVVVDDRRPSNRRQEN